MVYKYVQTLPVFTPEAYQGTYEIKGKSVFVDFPSFEVNATVNGNSMKGVVTYKGTNKKVEWILARTSSNQQSNSSSGNSNPKVNILWLDGIWEGAAYQSNTKTTWTIKLTARNNTYLIEYPSLTCGGKWTLVNKSSSVVEFKEKITYGVGRCYDDGNVIIEKIKDSQITVKFFEPNSSIVIASTTLNKR